MGGGSGNLFLNRGQNLISFMKLKTNQPIRLIPYRLVCFIVTFICSYIFEQLISIGMTVSALIIEEGTQ